MSTINIAYCSLKEQSTSWNMLFRRWFLTERRVGYSSLFKGTFYSYAKPKTSIFSTFCQWNKENLGHMLIYVFPYSCSAGFISHANVSYMNYEYYLRDLKEAEELFHMGFLVMIPRILPCGDQGGLSGPEGRQWMWEYC